MEVPRRPPLRSLPERHGPFEVPFAPASARSAPVSRGASAPPPRSRPAPAGSSGGHVQSFAPRRRLFAAAVVVLLAGSAVTLRLAFLQLVRHGHYAERAEVNQREREALLPVRGTIRDRDGRLLAQDARTYTIVAEPRRMDDPARAARRIARALRLDPERLAREFKKRPGFCYVDRNRSPQDAQIVRDSLAAGAWKGLVLSATVRRDYPAGPALAQITGRADIDNRGVEGIEYQFDSMLRGEQGWRTVLADGRGRHVGLPGWSQRKPGRRALDRAHRRRRHPERRQPAPARRGRHAEGDEGDRRRARPVDRARSSPPRPSRSPSTARRATRRSPTSSSRARRSRWSSSRPRSRRARPTPDDVYDAENGAYAFAGVDDQGLAPVRPAQAARRGARLEQHRRRQARPADRRADDVRVLDRVRLRRAHRARVPGRDARPAAPSLALVRPLAADDRDGPRDVGDRAAAGARLRRDRQRRDADGAADPQARDRREGQRAARRRAAAAAHASSPRRPRRRCAAC